MVSFHAGCQKLLEAQRVATVLVIAGMASELAETRVPVQGDRRRVVGAHFQAQAVASCLKRLPLGITAIEYSRATVLPRRNKVRA